MEKLSGEGDEVLVVVVWRDMATQITTSQVARRTINEHARFRSPSPSARGERERESDPWAGKASGVLVPGLVPLCGDQND